MTTVVQPHVDAPPVDRAAALAALLQGVRDHRAEFTACGAIGSEFVELMKRAGVYRAMVLASSAAMSSARPTSCAWSSGSPSPTARRDGWRASAARRSICPPCRS